MSARIPPALPNAPKLECTSVKIGYLADDGYSMEQEHVTPSAFLNPTAPPEAALLAGLEELARLTALFGFADEAEKRFHAARGRVAEFLASSGSRADECVNLPAEVTQQPAHPELLELLHRGLRTWETPPAWAVQWHDRLTGVPAPVVRPAVVEGGAA